MANPACMSQDGREAVFVGTMLQTGDAFTLCDECLVGWSAALLQSMTGVDPTPFLQAISAGTPEGGDDNPGEDPEHEIGTSDGEPSAPPGSDPSAAAATPAAAAASDPPPPAPRRGRTSAASPAAGTETGPPDGGTPAETDPSPPAA